MFRFDLIKAVTRVSGAEAIEWISKAFTDDSALLKHELAYCLGQMQDRRAIHTLTAVLKDTQQEPMVRHEAGEHIHLHTFCAPTVSTLCYINTRVISQTTFVNSRRTFWCVCATLTVRLCRGGSGSDWGPYGSGAAERVQSGSCDRGGNRTLLAVLHKQVHCFNA